MTLEKYYDNRMKEMGFIEDVECVRGYYRGEASYNTIAEYGSSYEYSLEDIHYMESLGYSVEDFFLDAKKYFVVIEDMSFKRIILETESYKEALEMYEAYNNGNGRYIDQYEFEWDLYIDEEELL